jgi:hypothetical protein
MIFRVAMVTAEMTATARTLKIEVVVSSADIAGRHSSPFRERTTPN